MCLAWGSHWATLEVRYKERASDPVRWRAGMKRSYGYKNIELRQLRSFCLAATQSNFTVAAEALGLSVPTVWEQVRALERKLRAPLLARRGRVVELTAEG